MRSITLRNYRCFGDEPQQARLAPLTLLVGENSSGKTSLMAMVRAMWDVAYGERVPNFKEDPYDLGSFDEIAHHRSTRGGRATAFESRFEVDRPRRRPNGRPTAPLRFTAEFAEQWSAPVPVRRRVECSDSWFQHEVIDADTERLELGSTSGRWICTAAATPSRERATASSDSLVSLDRQLFGLRFAAREGRSSRWKVQALDNSPELTEKILIDLEAALTLQNRIKQAVRDLRRHRPFASAPVRSQPNRTYDPSLVAADAVGDYVPTYLAQLALRAPEAWSELKERIESFGRSAEIFDELRIRRHGTAGSDSFQVQVRKFGSRRARGPYRNLVDVGYGVSQVLPVITELLRDDGPRTLLLQQPEVHLHPSAQAALGGLLCQLAATRSKQPRRQIIVETHSDFIIDRVRMAVRDELAGLSPEEVSIVFFERCGLDVRLHSISVDRLGNIEGAPAGYRQFFMDELQRSLGG